MSTINKIKVGGTIYDIACTAYPVGSIYLSVNDTSPAELFGGTWEQLKDRFLLAAGDTYSVGSTGGESQHTLTEDEMPAHRHLPYANGNGENSSRLFMGNNTYFDPSAGTSNYSVQPSSGGSKGYKALTNFVGGSHPHNNMPPYLAVYMWKRIA